MDIDRPWRQLTKKVCLLGDFSVGKTSLVRRFVEGCFDERYLSTIGAKVDRKVLKVPTPEGELILTLMLWDLAGGPGVGPVAPSYYRGASGAVIACDLTRPETAAGVLRYAEGFLAANPSAALVLAANKLDLVDRPCLAEDDLAAVAAGARSPLFLTSARTGEGVEAMFHRLGQLLVPGASRGTG
jgi:small GTP-binding protein